jgi:hypothetical protein
MRDLVYWCKARGSQLLVLCSFALLLVWQNIEPPRGDRHFRTIVAEIRETFRQQETIREVQFTRLLQTMERRFAKLDEAVTFLLEKSSKGPAKGQAPELMLAKRASTVVPQNRAGK